MKLLCIDNHYTTDPEKIHGITIGKTYEGKFHPNNRGFYKIVNDNGTETAYSYKLFEVVELKVECVSNSYTWDVEKKYSLTIGKTYLASQNPSKRDKYTVINDDGRKKIYSIRLFKIAEEEKPVNYGLPCSIGQLMDFIAESEKTWVKCIQNRLDVDPDQEGERTEALTVGKVYESIPSPFRPKSKLVINDCGYFGNYHNKHFEAYDGPPLEEE